MKQDQTALVIGASGGIGLAITRALLQKAGFERVYATFRRQDSPGGLFEIDDDRLLRLNVDVVREDDLQSLADAISENGDHPDLVINCAGILHEGRLQPEKSLKQCHPDNLARLFAVNSIGPLLVAKAVIPLMPKRRPAHFAALSAMVGSIGDNRLGGWYGYRASKAALNQLMRTLAVECRRTHPGLCISAIHPGTTDTGLSRPFQANVRPGKLYTATETASRILRVIHSGNPENSGRFVNWDGNAIPW
jgi:NAD(P)-dependent dehydrogenase (short-subunit alcohol dehydrogenase family)